MTAADPKSMPAAGAAMSTAAPVPPPAAFAGSWAGEIRGALNATATTLPFVLSYGFIAFAALGAAGAQVGLTASVVSVALGALLLALLSPGTLPSASPSASMCLILGAAIATWLGDPALRPDTPAGAAALAALVGATVAGTGVVMIVMGLCGAGRLVRYVPQPVLAGFMNGIALLIAVSQLPAALGVPTDVVQRDGLAALAGWQGPALTLALLTALLVVGTGRLAPRAPAALLALVLAGAAFAALQAALTPATGVGRTLAEIARIGPLQATMPWPDALAPLFGDGAAVLARHAREVLATALLLALIGALESVLNLATIDPLRSRRADPDRTLIGLGGTNVVLGLFGALPVVFLRLRALSTLRSGGRSWRSFLVGSALMLIVFMAGLPLVAQLPKPVVAGIVIMLAWALVDPWSLGLVRRRDGGEPEHDRRASLLVVAAVGATTVVWGFVAGVALGVLLSFLILVRALNRSLVRLRFGADEIPSRRVYPPAHEALLREVRRGIGVLELEGALFFGNVERLRDEAEAAAATLPAGARGAPRTLVLDLRRVSTLDASGAVMLWRLQAALAAGGVTLRLAGVAPDNRHGLALRAHGVLPESGTGSWRLHDDADRAIEAAEREGLGNAALPALGTPVTLADCELFAGLDGPALARIEPRLAARRLAAGERLFALGDEGEALYVLMSGSISVVDRARRQRFVTFSPGMTFGEMALLDGGGRTADALADEASEVCALGARDLAELERDAPEVAARIYRNLALHLATRLRDASGAWRRAAG